MVRRSLKSPVSWAVLKDRRRNCNNYNFPPLLGVESFGAGRIHFASPVRNEWIVLHESTSKNSPDLNYFCPATIGFAEQHSDVVKRNILFPSKDFSLVFSPPSSTFTAKYGRNKEACVHIAARNSPHRKWLFCILSRCRNLPKRILRVSVNQLLQAGRKTN